MPLLSVGDKLGHYQILVPLGAGGMGEVYRARDPRLKRDVALKILPAEVAGDTARRQRFDQEARAVAALNHPNIVAIYDVGEENGVYFIVSELIDGESLRKLIDRGPVPSDRLTNIVIQLASAIGAAHSAGIVHRDLKPENIMLTRDGRPKILDFGLAKQILPSAGQAESAETQLMTEAGVVVGTAAYMSPEQVRAEPADFRSDIFSLGGVLYEMASGKRAFSGASRFELMNAILTHEPAPLPPQIGRGLDSIIRRCLEKERERRFQSASDLEFALDRAADSFSQRRTMVTAGSAGAAWAVMAVLLAGLVGGLGYWAAERRTVPPKPQVQIENPTKSPPAPVRAPPAERTNPLGEKRGDRGSSAAPAVTPPAKPVKAPAAKREARSEETPVSPLYQESTPTPLPQPGPPPTERTALEANAEGNRLSNQSKWAEALVAYDEAIRRQPDYADAYVSRCAVYGVLNQPQRGIQDCDEALRLKPDSAIAHMNRGSRYLQLRQYDRAIQDLDAGIRLFPNAAGAYQRRGQAHFQLQQYELAVQDFNECIRLEPNSSLHFVDRGNTFNRLKQYQRAIQDFSEAIRLKPDDAYSYNQRAYAKDMLNDAEGAAVDRRYARELSATKQ